MCQSARHSSWLDMYTEALHERMRSLNEGVVSMEALNVALFLDVSRIQIARPQVSDCFLLYGFPLI